MSKKCMIFRNERKKDLIQKFSSKRLEIKNNMVLNRDNLEVVFKLQQDLASLPRSSSKTRSRNICFITGRSRSVYKRFGLSRIQLRKMASFADIPGVKKSSW